MKRVILAAITAAFLGSFAAFAATEAKPASGSFSNPTAAKADRAFGDNTDTGPNWGTGSWNATATGSWNTTLDLTFTNSADVEREAIVIKATPAQWRRWNKKYGAGFGDTAGTRRVPGRILARGTVASGATELYERRISNRGGPVVVVMSRDEMATGGTGWGFGSGSGRWNFVTGGRFPEGRGGTVTDTIDVSGAPVAAVVDVDHAFAGISFGEAIVTYNGGGVQRTGLSSDGRFVLNQPGVAFNLQLVVSSSTVSGVALGAIFSFQTDGPDTGTEVGANDPLTIFPGVALGETFRVDASTQQ